MAFVASSPIRHLYNLSYNAMIKTGCQKIKKRYLHCVGFEPTLPKQPAPKAGPVTTWVTMLLSVQLFPVRDYRKSIVVPESSHSHVRTTVVVTLRHLPGLHMMSACM